MLTIFYIIEFGVLMSILEIKNRITERKRPIPQEILLGS